LKRNVRGELLSIQPEARDSVKMDLRSLCRERGRPRPQRADRREAFVSRSDHFALRA